ncbi:hypothetical protein ACFWIW_24645 [Amycolatopsis sp. NPDC058340]|uniref:hypothetical protein n=1 Tax=Amycolatopsis sp. NPDC058340 TaxID=3346453 RepID=UPI00364F43F4
MVVEIPLVYAAVSHSSGTAQLAALGVCIAVLVVVNSPALAITPLVVTHHDSYSLRRWWRYVVATGSAGVLVLLSLAALPAAGRVITALVGSQHELTGAVRAGLLGLAPNSLAVAMRRYLHGRCIQLSRTSAIARASIIRIGGSGGLAWLGVALWPQHGTLVAGAALSAGALIETGLLAAAVGKLPAVSKPASHGRLRMLILAHAHLSAARLLYMAPMAVTTIGIAHSASPAPSLVVWPALYELAMLFASPTGDWESVTANAVRAGNGGRAARRLTLLLMMGYTALFATILCSGLIDGYLTGLLAVPAGPAELGLQAAPLLLPIPMLWILRAHLRGNLMARHRVGRVAVAAAAHLACLTGAAAALSRTPLPGVSAACLTLLGGLLAELAVLTFGGVSINACQRISRVVLPRCAFRRPEPGSRFVVSHGDNQHILM